MMSAYSQGVTPLLTKRHSSHDEMWLLQNSSFNVICFACAIETLEDKTTLNVRKRKMVAEILDLLTTNRLIWDIFLKHNTTLQHTGNVLLQLLTTQDKQLSSLLVETISAFVQRVRDENAVNFLHLLVNAIRTAKDRTTDKIHPYVCLLGKILRSSNAMVKNLLLNNQWVLGTIADSLDKVEEKEAVSYWFVFAQIYRAGNDVDISQDISKQLLEKIVSAVAKSVSKELQLNILAVLISYASKKVLRSLIFEQEDQEVMMSKKSMADVFKKLMLSPVTSVQIGSTQCLAEILSVSTERSDEVVNFAGLMIDKGLCEFLFELLQSSEPFLVASVFDCLLKLSNCQKFFSTGHIIYGFEPIVQALLKIVERRNKLALMPGLGLLLKTLEEDSCTPATVVKDLKWIFKVLVNVSEIHETRVLEMGILCTNALLKKIPRDAVDFNTVKLLLKTYGKTALRKATNESSKATADPGIMGLLLSTLDFATCILKHWNEPMQEEETDWEEKCQYFGTIQCHLCNVSDLYLIPATVILLPFIRDSRIFKGFFELLLLLLESKNGDMFAKKLCEASFIRMASEIKCRLLVQKDAELNISNIHKFLVSLANKIEDPRKQITVGTVLMKTLSSLTLPPREWHLYFGKGSSSKDAKVIVPVRSACLSLVYLSTRFGNEPILNVETIIKGITNCLLDGDSFEDDVTNRNLLYLWSYARGNFQNEDQNTFEGEKRLLFILEGMIEINNSFINEKCFIQWVLAKSESLRVKQWVLTEAFSSLIPSSGGSKNNTVHTILDVLSPFNTNTEFYTTCINIIAYQNDEVTAQAVRVVTQLVQNSSGVTFVPGLKGAIVKLIFRNGSDLSSINATALLRIYQDLLLKVTDAISDEDLKFASMVCNLFMENPYPNIRIGVLNFLNQFLSCIHKRGSSFQAAVICKENFIKEIFSLLPRSLTFAGESFERLSAACLVLASQLMMVVSSQNLEEILSPTIKLEKAILLKGMTFSKSILLQNACLIFWCYLLGPERSEIGFLQQNSYPFKLDSDEMRTLLFSMQNLIFSEEPLTRKMACKCFISILQVLNQTVPEIKSPWNGFILNHCIQSLINPSERVFSIRLLQQLLEYGVQVEDRNALVSSIMNILKDHPLENQQSEVFMMKIVFFLVDQNFLSDEDKGDVNCYLHRLEDCLNGLIGNTKSVKKDETLTHFILNDVLFPIRSEDFSLEEFLPEIVNYRAKVTCNK